MNNQELELKIKEILDIENFFDMMESVVDFEKEYKGTSFYKKTKMSLFDVVKSSKAWYSLTLKNFGKTIQDIIDGLSLENISTILTQLGNVYEKENEDVFNIIKEFKELVK